MTMTGTEVAGQRCLAGRGLSQFHKTIICKRILDHDQRPLWKCCPDSKVSDFQTCKIQVRNFKIKSNETNLHKNSTFYIDFTQADYLQYISSQANIGWTGTWRVFISATWYRYDSFIVALIKGKAASDTPLQEGAPTELSRVFLRSQNPGTDEIKSHSGRKEDHVMALEAQTSLCSLQHTQCWSLKCTHYFTCLM